MRKDMVVFDIKAVASEPGYDEIFEFAALRVSNGEIKASCRFQIRPGGNLNTPESLGNFSPGAVWVGYDISLSFLESRWNLPLQQPLWDTLDLARIFFPTLHHYQLSYLAEKLALPLKSEEGQDSSEERLRLIWELFKACWRKGLEFDLSFFNQTKGFLDGWVLQSFMTELQKEMIRSFPDRPIRTDLVLMPSAEGIFQRGKTPAQGIPERIDWVIEHFSPGGNLERNLGSYESRPGQVRMAKLVAEGLSSSQHVVVEAGTGTGKSFAYLLPSLWFAKITSQTVVIATHTIPLQEQLLKNDIPVLQSVLPFSFRAAVLKGRNNYCCLKKWQSCLVNKEISPGEQLAGLSILVWLRETVSGDIQELAKVPGLTDLWARISADNDTCIPGKCSKAGVCFLLRARKRAEESDILIVNHSLLFSDLKTDYNVLPEYHHLVIDEAHQIYQTALQHLGSELCAENVNRVVENIYRPAGLNFYGTIKHRLEALAYLAPAVSWELFRERLESIPEICMSVLTQAGELFELFSRIIGRERTFRFILQHKESPWWNGLYVQIENLAGRVDLLSKAFEGLNGILNGEDAEEIEELRYIMNGHQRELQTVSATLMQAVNIENPQQVTWLEQSPRLNLKTSPIEVSDILKAKIFSRLESVILTSATLSISNSFAHFLKDIGLAPETITAQVDSPFDYEQQMHFIVTKEGINSLSSDEEKSLQLTEFIAEVAQRLQGRTLVLFTAHNLLRQTYASLQPVLAGMGLNTLAQGVQGDRSTLIEAFRRNPRSVLLGANSFWEGIDIPGDALLCVIMVKLPFWPPTLPLIEARSDYLKSQGRDPFRELLLPEAVIRFKQGFGRLIRSKMDRGMVILLDNRVIDKYYGRYFLNSLPVKTHIRGEKSLVFRKIEEYTRDLEPELL